VKSQQRAYIRKWWASEYLWDQGKKDDRPIFSRCRISEGKWLWVVHGVGGWCDEEEPLARGIAESPEAAYQAAVEAAGPVRQVGNWVADVVREKEAALKRSQRTTENDAATPLEFVYECGEGFAVAHRIVKRTTKRIYVEREPWRENGDLHDDWRDYVRRTFILDRKEFEDKGKAKRSGRWYGTYYADPAIYDAEGRASAFRPEYLSILELPAGASVDAIHAAYRRLARKTHPDHGGDAEEFKRVTAAYEKALLSGGHGASCFNVSA